MGQLSDSNVTDYGPDRIVVTLGGRAVATINADPSMVNTLQASSTAGMPALDLLGGLVSNQPSGVVVVRQGVEGLTFALEDGRVVGAFGTGPRGAMQSWSALAREQVVRDGGDASLSRLFLRRCVLEHLPMTTEIGAIVSVFRGDVRWSGETVEVEHAPRLQHLLMDFARETDDCKVLERKLQPLSRLAVPLAPPSPSAEPGTDAGGDENEDDFGGLGEDVDDEGEAILTAVWKMCDNVSSIDAIAERSVFGRMATLGALETLQRRDHIRLVKAAQDTLLVLPDIELPPPAATTLADPSPDAEPESDVAPRSRWLLLGGVVMMVLLAVVATVWLGR